MLRQAEAQVEKNPKEALDLALRAQNCSRRLGDLYYYLTDYDKAMVHYLRAQALFLRLARDVGSEKAALHLAHIQAAMGNILRAVGNLSEAAEA
ncbi:MAG: hypothetical protein NZ869_07475 [Thermoanaerobaculum sp.]|nr:hypothetical protein [Thermoanaerobaculum sp.]MDW7968014.1 hypothetical protein [Thermoanaerobaculum sp.]